MTMRQRAQNLETLRRYARDRRDVAAKCDADELDDVSG